MPSAVKQKIACVFVHGWAMNSAVWQNLLADLPEWLDITCVDLPGHGSMAALAAGDLDAQAQQLAAVSPRPTIWVGWSMGGLVTLRLAQRYSERVAGLFMVASNPCFVRRENWSSAVAASVFDDFATALETDVAATLRRFLALQVLGDKRALKRVRELETMMHARGQASAQALRNGLALLQQSDLRAELAQLDCPMHWLLGERDTLVPASLAEQLSKINPAIEISIEAGAGHAPFLSHPDNFRRALLEFAGRMRVRN